MLVLDPGPTLHTNGPAPRPRYRKNDRRCISPFAHRRPIRRHPSGTETFRLRRAFLVECSRSHPFAAGLRPAIVCALPTGSPFYVETDGRRPEGRDRRLLATWAVVEG